MRRYHVLRSRGRDRDPRRIQRYPRHPVLAQERPTPAEPRPRRRAAFSPLRGFSECEHRDKKPRLHLTLPDTGETLTLENLELAEIEGGYTLSTPVGAEGPVLELVIMGTVVTGTLRVGGEDLYVITPLSNGNAVVHRQHPEEGAPAAHEHHHHHDLDLSVIHPHGAGATATNTEPEALTRKDTGAPVIDVLFAYNDLDIMD